jgi:cellulose synthase/poly-beta-1,6-N-acetylglucosamine synthase-like glycosyltransferase
LEPIISVIINTCNNERTITRCISSILKSSRIEKILVDGGSDDKTIEFAQKFEDLKIIRMKRTIASELRNEGIKKSKGNIIAFMNGDCYAHKNWIYSILEDFKNEKVDVVFGPYLSVSSGGIGDTFRAIDRVSRSRKYNEKNKKIFDLSSHYFYFINGNNMIFKKKVFDKTGYFDVKFDYNFEDIDFQLRAIRKGFRFLFDPRICVTHDHPLKLKAMVVKGFSLGRCFRRMQKKHQRLIESYIKFDVIKYYVKEMWPFVMAILTSFFNQFLALSFLFIWIAKELITYQRGIAEYGMPSIISAFIGNFSWEHSKLFGYIYETLVGL